MELYNVLLVDDEADVLQAMKKKIDWEALGFCLAGTAENGQEALEMAEQLHIDVVMTDIKMPYMDGLTLCKNLKQSYRNMKVIIYSGFDDFEFAREAVHLEAEEYLLKPISAGDMEAAFSKVRKKLDQEYDEGCQSIIEKVFLPCGSSLLWGSWKDGLQENGPEL